MKVGMKLNMRDYDRVQARLQTIARRAPDHAARTLERAGLRIVKRAQKYVPEDTGALKDSIQMEKMKGADGRVFIDIVTADQITLEDGTVVPVEQYAVLIHENYESMIRNPGPKTLDKMALYGADKVGSKFISRAVADETAALRQDIYQAIIAVIEGS